MLPETLVEDVGRALLDGGVGDAEGFEDVVDVGEGEVGRSVRGG